MCFSSAAATVASTSPRGTGARLSRSISTVAALTKPGVQYPHWKLNWSRKACCTGESARRSPLSFLRAMPSMVRMRLPSKKPAPVMQVCTSSLV